MAIIKIGNFGGEAPSTSPRALPAGAAQLAQNLLASTAEFRPLSQDVVVATSATSSPRTLHRLARTETGEFNTNMDSGWITHEGVVNYVKGQINDDATERTYYTAGDGSFAPRVLDAAGADRLMGVPGPAVAPGVAGNFTKQFTQNDKQNAVASLNAQVLRVFDEALVPAKVGIPAPIGPQYRTYPPSIYRVFMLTAPRGAISNAFTGPVEEYSWVLDPSLNGVYVTDPSTSDHFYGINIPAYCDGYTLDEALLRSSLAALQVPGTNADSGAKDKDGNPVAPKNLLSQEQIDDLVRGMKNALNPEHMDGVGGITARLKAAVEVAKSIMDNKTQPTISANVTRYYEKHATEINDRIAGLAANIFNLAVNLVATPRTDGAPVTITAVSPIFGNAKPERAQAISNISAALHAGYNTESGAGGVKSLNVGTVTAFLNAGFQSIISTQPRNASEMSARLAQIDVNAEVRAMANWLAYGSFGTAGERPPAVDSSGQVAALKAALADVRTAAAAIALYYQEIKAGDKLAQVIGDYSDAQNLNDQIPLTVEQILEDRFYIATFVTDWGEESAPSPVSEPIELDQNDTATVAIEPPPPGRHITKWRVYRSNVGAQSAQFQLVDELGIDALTYTDERRASALGEGCPTLTWLEPPANLRGLVGMPNGIMAGFFDNTICFCDPYHPYAWPVEYQITTEFPIVGLGVFGQTLVVGTRGNPYFVSGSDSASMSAIKIDANQACVSARSIVPVNGGVIFASPDGLCLADQSGVRVLSAALWTREDWQKLRPQAIVATEHEGAYVFMCGEGGSKKCYMLGDGRLVQLQAWGSALYVDQVTDTLYMADGAAIKAAFRSPERRAATWRSGLMTLELQSPLAWAKVYSDFTAPVTLRWHADGALRHTATFNSLDPQRLPPGRWLEHEIEVESQARITSVILASTTDELKGI